MLCLVKPRVYSHLFAHGHSGPVFSACQPILAKQCKWQKGTCSRCSWLCWQVQMINDVVKILSNVICVPYRYHFTYYCHFQYCVHSWYHTYIYILASGDVQRWCYRSCWAWRWRLPALALPSTATWTTRLLAWWLWKAYGVSVCQVYCCLGSCHCYGMVLAQLWCMGGIQHQVWHYWPDELHVIWYCMLINMYVWCMYKMWWAYMSWTHTCFDMQYISWCCCWWLDSTVQCRTALFALQAMLRCCHWPRHLYRICTAVVFWWTICIQSTWSSWMTALYRCFLMTSAMLAWHVQALLSAKTRWTACAGCSVHSPDHKSSW